MEGSAVETLFPLLRSKLKARIQGLLLSTPLSILLSHIPDLFSFLESPMVSFKENTKERDTHSNMAFRSRCRQSQRT